MTILFAVPFILQIFFINQQPPSVDFHVPSHFLIALGIMIAGARAVNIADNE